MVKKPQPRGPRQRKADAEAPAKEPEAAETPIEPPAPEALPKRRGRPPGSKTGPLGFQRAPMAKDDPAVLALRAADRHVRQMAANGRDFDITNALKGLQQHAIDSISARLADNTRDEKYFIGMAAFIGAISGEIVRAAQIEHLIGIKAGEAKTKTPHNGAGHGNGHINGGEEAKPTTVVNFGGFNPRK